jgi:putative peptidoglycan lipid II flippase
VTVRTGPDITRGDETARDSVVIGTCTALSRATGVARVIVLGAVLGPTFLGNAFQITNALPNLIYFGFLAGSLFSSLLVPVLVLHVDKRDREHASLLSGGLLGVTWTVLLPVVPLAVLLLPELLHVVGDGAGAGVTQLPLPDVRLLVLLTMPQVFLYAVVGSSTAAMNAHRRFALASAAPAVENLGVIAVLAAVGVIYGSGSSQGSSPPLGELLLLSIGSTAAVAVHAGIQWWGAYRNGVTIVPRRGWRQPEVVAILGRSLRAATLLAVQMLALLVLASRVGGGSVAIQMGLNFYFLPIALVATPVGLALLPRLSRLHIKGDSMEFGRVFIDGLTLALFLVTPAAVGYVVLAEPLARALSAGQMNTPFAVHVITASIAALALGMIGQTIFFVSTQAAYSRGDSRTPLGSMFLQAAICLAICAVSPLVPDASLNAVLGGGFAVASLAAGAHQLHRVTRDDHISARPLVGSLARAGSGALVMAVIVWLVVSAVGPSNAQRTGWIVTLLVGSSVGLATYLLSQAAMRSPELSRLRSAVRGHRSSLADVEGAT